MSASTVYQPSAGALSNTPAVSQKTIELSPVSKYLGLPNSSAIALSLLPPPPETSASVYGATHRTLTTNGTLPPSSGRTVESVQEVAYTFGTPHVGVWEELERSLSTQQSPSTV